eukprot:symbB.v1.2.029631.t1/scaffold3263.1/size104115/7
MRSRTVSTSVKQQRGQTQSLALCPASSSQMQMQSHMQGQMDLQMRQMISSISSVVAQGVRSAMGLEDENLDSPPSRAANLQFLKPKAKQTPSPPPAESQPVLLSKVAGSSFPALGDQAPVEASASHPEPADPAGRKDEEADPSPFASERKSALRHPAGSKAAALSPNKVKFDPADVKTPAKPAAKAEAAKPKVTAPAKAAGKAEAAKPKGTAPAKPAGKAEAAKPKGTAPAKPPKAAAAQPKAKSATSSKSNQRPPPMEPGQGTVYYMQGKVHRNSGCFRVFKLASDKKDLKIKIVPDVPISELWNRALEIIEAAAAEPWDAD